jgi:hypothetical protein
MPNTNTHQNSHQVALKVESLEDRTVLSSPFGLTRGMSLAAGQVFQRLVNSGVNQYVTGTGPGTIATVKIYNNTGKLLQAFHPFGNTFTGGVTVAVGDVTAGGVGEIICGTGPGTSGEVKVFAFQNGGRQLLANFFPFGMNFNGGINVAAGVVTGANPNPKVLNPDNIVVSVASNGPPTVKVYSYDPSITGGAALLRSFNAYTTNYTGGVSLTVGNIDTAADTLDMNGNLTGHINSYAEIITGQAEGLPHVKIFDASTPTIVTDASYMAFNIANPANRHGINVVAADTTGQRGDDIYVNLKSSVMVRLFVGETSAVLKTFIGLPKNKGNPPMGDPNVVGSSSQMLTMASADMTGNNGPDNNFAGQYFQRDLLIAAADGPYNQVPQVFKGGGNPAGFNGSAPA